MHVSLLPNKPLLYALQNTFFPLDRSMFARNWLVPAPFFNPLLNSHRIVMNCYGFSPKSIRTELQGNQLVVIGNESNKKSNNEDYSVKKFRKTFQLPSNLDSDKLTSYMGLNGNLIIDIPFKKSQSQLTAARARETFESDEFPKISDDKKSVSLSLTLPKHINPDKLDVKTKDGKLVVKYQDKKEEKTDHGYSKAKISFYRQILLPKNTNLNELKHKMENNKLAITAPLLLNSDNANIN